MDYLFDRIIPVIENAAYYGYGIPSIGVIVLSVLGIIVYRT